MCDRKSPKTLPVPKASSPQQLPTKFGQLCPDLHLDRVFCERSSPPRDESSLLRGKRPEMPPKKKGGAQKQKKPTAAARRKSPEPSSGEDFEDESDADPSEDEAPAAQKRHAQPTPHSKSWTRERPRPIGMSAKERAAVPNIGSSAGASTHATYDSFFNKWFKVSNPAAVTNYQARAHPRGAALPQSAHTRQESPSERAGVSNTRP